MWGWGRGKVLGLGSVSDFGFAFSYVTSPLSASVSSLKGDLAHLSTLATVQSACERGA